MALIQFVELRAPPQRPTQAYFPYVEEGARR